ncbi:MAG: DNA polymerase III subunit alpha, partial [Bdellovibrionales bacterium]|nr:DNA polymerase III subunit alpha [Bdellovibrionales bacterium]
MSFVHLHNHSSYSLLKGTLTFEEMCKKCVEFGMPAVALTDYGNLHGAFEFFQTAKKHGIKPIIGLDITLVDGDAKEKSNKYPQYNLVLLAENDHGLKNLYRLATLAAIEGFYYKPRIDWTDLEKHHEGLIALTGNRFGIVGKYVQDERLDVAKEKLSQLSQIMGKNQLYLELMNTGLPIQEKINQAVVSLSSELGIPYVAANDCHYLNQDDERSHDVVLCVGSGKFIYEENRLKFPTNQYYFRNTEEMKEIFASYPDAISNSLMIAEKCNVNLNRKGYFMPTYQTRDGKTLEEELQLLSQEGLQKRLLQKFQLEQIPAEKQQSITNNYTERLKEELTIINNMGFAGYFLIVQDFINYAKDHGIPVGPGRGSAAGSLVAYSLKITDIDPIPY